MSKMTTAREMLLCPRPVSGAVGSIIRPVQDDAGSITPYEEGLNGTVLQIYNEEVSGSQTRLLLSMPIQ